MSEAIQTEMKTCKTCTETKPVDDFYVNRNAKDGRQSQCRPCMKAYGAKWRTENREHRAAYEAKYRAENRERLLDYQAKWRAENPDRKTKWYAANREHVATYNAQWRADNPEYGAQHRADSPHVYWEAQYRRRARAFGFDPVVRSFTRDEMLTYWNNGPFCIYCDAPFTEIEHLIPVGLGGIHAVENVAPSCVPCNRQNVNTVRRERRAMA